MPNRASFIQHSNKEEEEKKPNKKNQNSQLLKKDFKQMYMSIKQTKRKEKNISKIATK